MSNVTDAELRSAIRRANDRVMPVTMTEVVERSIGGEADGSQLPGPSVDSEADDIVVLERGLSSTWALSAVAVAAVLLGALFLGDLAGNRLEAVAPLGSTSVPAQQSHPDSSAPEAGELMTSRVAKAFAQAYVSLDADAVQALVKPRARIYISVYPDLSLTEQFDHLRAGNLAGEVESCVVWDDPTMASCRIRMDDELGRAAGTSMSTYLKLRIEDGLVVEADVSRASLEIYIGEVWVPFIQWAVANQPSLVDLAFPEGVDRPADIGSSEGAQALTLLIDLYLLELETSESDG